MADAPKQMTVAALEARISELEAKAVPAQAETTEAFEARMVYRNTDSEDPHDITGKEMRVSSQADYDAAKADGWQDKPDFPPYVWPKRTKPAPRGDFAPNANEHAPLTPLSKPEDIAKSREGERFKA